MLPSFSSVITIITLLILASVSIAMLTGENGILTQAQNAKNKTEEVAEKEGVELVVTSSKLKNSPTLEILKENLETAIKEQFGNNKDFTVKDNGDGNFLISMNDTNRKYYVENTGNIINESNMLKISTADELKEFRDNVNRGNSYEDWYIYLANNITLDINEEWEPIGIYLKENTSPDDETNKPFKGIFDGNGYEIDGIYINTTDRSQGLFGLVNNGKILNLGIGENCSINSSNSAGAVAGYLSNKSYANNCYNKTEITIGGYGGGVFGQLWSETKIENCYNLGNVNVNEDGYKRTIGGVVGQINEGSQMYNCYNKGNINSNNTMATAIGGVVGGVTGIVEECYNSGQVNGNQQIGGIAGTIVRSTDFVEVQKCYNTGIISGNLEVGGIAGLNQEQLSNCYNKGNVSGETMIGGIVGNNQGMLNNSYNIGSISCNTTYVGGISGQNDRGTIKNTYSLLGICGNINGVNINGTIETSEIKTEEEMKLLAQVLGSAFEEDKKDINNGYPILCWQKEI